jgi:hypothetical protein
MLACTVGYKKIKNTEPLMSAKLKLLNMFFLRLFFARLASKFENY